MSKTLPLLFLRLFLTVLTIATVLFAARPPALQTGTSGMFLAELAQYLIALPLLFMVAAGFWTAALGFFECLAHRCTPAVPPLPPPGENSDRRSAPSRTAIVMPIYNEQPAEVFSRLRAMYEAVEAACPAGSIDFFVLSDTTDPEIWITEEIAFILTRQNLSGQSGFYYRRRPTPVDRKSGNIRDFCQEFGSAYRYMIVLDADSSMEAATIREMIRRMDADPDLGILQVAPTCVNRHTVFARMQQFSTSVYGPVFVAGYARWTQTDGNYWGHNAIIRVHDFIQSCGLPHLPGRKPLGGSILSHDFVEAALMRRSGKHVVLAPDLGGSYEEPPTTIRDFAQRNQRWCQGNLQHLALILADGFHPMNRLHFAMGVMAYLSSPLWLAYMILAAVSTALGAASGAVGTTVPTNRFLIVVLLLLFLPKIFGYLSLLLEPQRLAAHGGAVSAFISVVFESALSVLLAPVFMLYDTAFVISTFAGRTIEWNSQQRSNSDVSLEDARRAHGGHTIVGVFGMLLAAWLAPAALWWLLPVLAGLILSIPLDIYLSGTRRGIQLLHQGLFLIPEESRTSPLLLRQRQCLKELSAALSAQIWTDPFRILILNPGFNDFHIGLLRPRNQAVPPVNLDPENLLQVALHGGPEHLSKQERLWLLSDEQSLRWLHRQAWTLWNVEPHPQH
jgi:membrane glycosyltransferase